jgi:hypothetical protein
VTFEEMEAGLTARLKALPPAARAELLHVLRLPDLDPRPNGSASSGGTRRREFGEPLIDCEEDRTLRAVLVWDRREVTAWAKTWRRREPLR